MKKAIFLDRDGVINEDNDCLIYKKEQVRILPNVKEALKQFKENGYFLVVISNQPAIARGIITEKNVTEINRYINVKLDNIIDKFYFCPHHPNADLLEYRKNCICRKPSPGLILQAAKELNIDLKKSWMIGDRISDIQAGKLAGCKTILIESENNKKIIESGVIIDTNIKPDKKVNNLMDASNLIRMLK
ncbi:MAG: HAD family hydrolase [Candidatus Pacearchaeota archaeon]